MSDALRNFLFLKDPLAKGYSITVTQAELEALLEAHESELAVEHEVELADLEQDLASLQESLDMYECIEDHCEEHAYVCPECGAETT